MSESVNTTLNIARQVAVNAQGGDTTGIQAPSDPNELAQLSIMIKTWREIQKKRMNSMLKSKKRRNAPK